MIGLVCMVGMIIPQVMTICSYIIRAFIKYNKVYQRAGSAQRQALDGVRLSLSNLDFVDLKRSNRLNGLI